MRVRAPASAASCAIPDPMVPAPTTPMAEATGPEETGPAMPGLKPSALRSSECKETAPRVRQLDRLGHERVDAGGGAPDDELLDLRRALVEGRDADVAEVTLDRVVVDVARAAVHLDRGVRALDRRLCCVELRDRRLGRVRLARVFEVPGPPDEHPGRVGLQDHVGDHRLHELERCDRTAELLALPRGADGAPRPPPA